MAEPFSLSFFIVTSTAAGILGNRTDAGVMKAWRTVVARMRQGGLPLNHDIQRGIRKSQLQATLLAVEARLKERGIGPSFLRAVKKPFARTDWEEQWLNSASDYIHFQLKLLKKPDYVPSVGEDEADIGRLLAPEGGDASEAVRALRDALAGTMLLELRLSLPHVPPRFEEMVSAGWDETDPAAGRTRWDWFEAVCAFFAYELKHNQPLANIVQTQFLLDARAEVAGMSEALDRRLQDSDSEMFNQLARIEESLGRMREEQAEGFSGLEDRLDELLPTLLLLPTVEAQQGMLLDVLRDEQELTRRLISEKHAESDAKMEEFITRASEAGEVQLNQAKDEIVSRLESLRLSVVKGAERRPIPISLPALRGAFVDRQDEQATLRRLLRESGLRLIVIIAPGGYGKTEMITKVLRDITSGHSITDENVRGILYLRCVQRDISLKRLFAEGGRIVGRSDEFAQVHDSKDLSDDRKLEFFFRELSDEGDIWLVLDNFEDLLAPDDTVADPDLRKFIETAVATEHSLRLIATSRAVPRFEGSWQIGLIPLMGGLPEDYAVEYLRTQGAECGLASEDEGLLRSLANRVHYIPKALEAVVGYIYDKYPAITLADLMSNDALFADFDRYDAEKGLKRLVGEQFNELEPDHRATMFALSVFTKAVPAEALQYCLGAVDFKETLPRLTRNRLVETQKAEHGILYDLHPVVREYVYGRLPSAGADAGLFTRQTLHARAAAFFRALSVPPGRWHAAADVQPQLDEFHHLVRAGGHVGAALLLGELDLDYLLPWGEARRVLTMGEQLAGRLTDPVLAASNELRLGLACRNLGLYKEALDHLSESLRGAREAGDERIERLSLGSLGISHYYLGESDKAIEFCKEAVRKSAEHGFDEQKSEQLRFLGHAHEGSGRYSEAMKYYAEALSAAKEIEGEKGRRFEENAQGGLAKALMALGRYEEAADELARAVRTAREINDRRGECFNLANLALARRELASLDEADATYAEALAVARDIGERNVEGYCLGGQGKILILRRQFDAAAASLLNALDMTRGTNMKGGQQHWSTTLAQAYLHGGRLGEAEEAILPALGIDVIWNNYRTWAVYGVILARLGRAEEAADAFLKAASHASASLERDVGSYGAWFKQGLSFAGLAALTHDPERKADYAGRAREAYRSARDNCSAGGAVMGALYLFDELPSKGQEELLASIRPYIVGGS